MPYVCWYEADAWSSNTDSRCVIRRQNQKSHSTLPHSPGNGHLFLQKRKKKILELQCSETSFSVAKGQQGRKQTHSWHSPEHSVPQTQSQAIAKPQIIETQLTLYVCILFNKLFPKKKQRGTQNDIFIQKKRYPVPLPVCGSLIHIQNLLWLCSSHCSLGSLLLPFDTILLSWIPTGWTSTENDTSFHFVSFNLNIKPHILYSI